MELSFKSDNNIDIKINLDKPRVTLSNEELYEGTVDIPISKIMVNGIYLNSDENMCKKYASLKFGFKTELLRGAEAKVYLQLKDKLVQEFYKILKERCNLDTIEIEAPKEFMEIYDEKVTTQCLKVLNIEIKERCSKLYKEDILLKDKINTSIRKVDTIDSYDIFKVNIENKKLSIIASKAETVLEDASEFNREDLYVNLNNYKKNETEWSMQLLDLKKLIIKLANIMNYEDEYLDKELFKY